jgi:hypothetical protein
MGASRITARCPHGHEINTGVRGRGVSCRCGATVYVRADGSTRPPAEARPAAPSEPAATPPAALPSAARAAPGSRARRSRPELFPGIY